MEYENIPAMKIEDTGSQCDDAVDQVVRDKVRNIYGLKGFEEEPEEHYNFKSPIKIKMRSRSSIEISTDHHPHSPSRVESPDDTNYFGSRKHLLNTDLIEDFTKMKIVFQNYGPLESIDKDSKRI